MYPVRLRPVAIRWRQAHFCGRSAEGFFLIPSWDEIKNVRLVLSSIARAHPLCHSRVMLSSSIQLHAAMVLHIGQILDTRPSYTLTT
jgi:hypothetical protein